MAEDLISIVGLDVRGGLLIKPATARFPYIYREAMDVSWEPGGAYLYGPKPRERSYADWFRQICAAAAEQGTILSLGAQTDWTNVPGEVRQQIEEEAGRL